MEFELYAENNPPHDYIYAEDPLFYGHRPMGAPFHDAAPMAGSRPSGKMLTGRHRIYEHTGRIDIRPAVRLGHAVPPRCRRTAAG